MQGSHKVKAMMKMLSHSLSLTVFHSNSLLMLYSIPGVILSIHNFNHFTLYIITYVIGRDFVTLHYDNLLFSSLKILSFVLVLSEFIRPLTRFSFIPAQLLNY